MKFESLRAALKRKRIILPFVIFLIIANAYMNPIEVDRTETIRIMTTREAAWEVATDFKTEFESNRSNPDHDGGMITSDPPTFQDGMAFTQWEYVGPFYGTLDGEVFEVHPPHRYSWKARVSYSFIGISFATLKEGGDFRIEHLNDSDDILITHRVYSDFGAGASGRILSWFASAIFGTQEDASEHTLVELRFLKKFLEQQKTAG